MKVDNRLAHDLESLLEKDMLSSNESRIEVYDENFKLLRLIIINNAVFDHTAPLTKTIEKSSKFKYLLSKYDYGHTIHKINDNEELDFYFLWDIDSTNRKTVTIFYDFKDTGIYLNYLPLVCYLILFINFIMKIKYNIAIYNKNCSK